ncbi:MAG: secretin and TonB N-terminal domain-containing protein [Nitrospirae bacterium]|nr:secretin and TonB N-terminal domain-containing protein [Nitrospirota bacterium]
MQSVSLFKKIVVLFICVVVYGCAAGTSETRSKGEGQEEGQNVQRSLGNVLNDVVIEDDRLRLTASDVFTYNIINTADPLKKIVELKGVEAGQYKDKLVIGKEGIVDVNVRESREPALATVLEIRLSSPLEVSEVVAQNALELTFKEPDMAAVNGGKSSEGRPRERGIEQPSNGTLKEARFITNVVFKRESASRSRVEISGDGQITADVFTLDGRIVVDIPKVRLAALKKQAVKMPLSTIRWVEHKDKVRVVLDVAEKLNYEVVMGGKVVDIVLTAPPGSKASKNAVIVSPAKKKTHGGKDPLATDDVTADVQARIERLKEDSRNASAEKGHGQEAGFPKKGTEKGLVTLDFNNADIVPIMRLISDVSGYNIVVDPGVKGKITLKLRDVPWDKALELILDTHNLEKEVDGNILKIRPKGTAPGAAKCNSQPVVIKDLTITFSNMGGIGRSIKRENVESGNGSICLDLNINLDGNTNNAINDMGDGKEGLGEKGEGARKGNKH